MRINPKSKKFLSYLFLSIPALTAIAALVLFSFLKAFNANAVDLETALYLFPKLKNDWDVLYAYKSFEFANTYVVGYANLKLYWLGGIALATFLSIVQILRAPNSSRTFSKTGIIQVIILLVFLLSLYYGLCAYIPTFTASNFTSNTKSLPPNFAAFFVLTFLHFGTGFFLQAVLVIAFRKFALRKKTP